jgi:transporter family-2 protein
VQICSKVFNGGCLLGAFYIFVTIFASSKIGFANMFSLVICGQIILSIIFDHYGFLGNEIHLINPQRILGVVLLITGAAIIQKF